MLASEVTSNKTFTEYLKTVKPNSRKNVSDKLKVLRIFEGQLNKPINLFTANDWANIFKYCVESNQNIISTSSSFNSFLSTVTTFLKSLTNIVEFKCDYKIKQYAIRSGAQEFSLKNEIKDIVSRDEMYSIVENEIDNPVEKALVVMLFEGVWGRSNKDETFEEIKNLKSSDCDFVNNSLLLTRNNGVTRNIVIPTRSMKIIEEASKTFLYYDKRGKKVSVK